MHKVEAMYQRSVLVLLCITLLMSSSRLYVETALCSPADGAHTKVFYLLENSDNGTLIGRLDLEGSGQTISLSIDTSYLSLPNQCGANGKKCNSWLSLEPSSQDLTLFLNEGEILDRDGPMGVKRIDAKIVCIATSDPNTGSNTDIYVVIFVEDVNDNDPIFVNDNALVSVNELTPQNTKIATLTVADQDEIYNRTFRIASSTKPECFTIPDSSVGDIVLVKNLDYESLTEISLVVEVEDRGLAETRTAVAAVTIRVIDGDDQPPMFQPCVQIADSCLAVIYHARLLRSAEPETELSFITPGPILAVDPDVDLSESTEIVYSVHSDPSSTVDAVAYFNIDQKTGIVVLQNVLPNNLPSEGFSLYIKATQVNNQNTFAFGKLIVTTVDILEDLHPPQIQKNNFKGFVHPQEGDVVFVRNADGSLLHLVATDEDYVDSLFVPPLDFEIVNQQSSFQVTKDGFVVYKRYKAEALNTLPATIQIRALNTEATSEQTRRSEIAAITVEESTTGEACEFIGCGENTTEGLIGGIAATSALLCAAFIAIILLAWVMVKYRRKSLRRKSLEGFQNHYANKLTLNHDSISNNINNNNVKYNQETVHRNQLSIISNNTVTSSSQPRHKGHRTQTHGKSSRYFANGKNNSPGINEDSPSIAPYESFSAIDAVRPNAAAYWENFDVKMTINYHQLSVEQETLHSSQKRGQRGFLTLENGHITKCYVKTYSESYPHKRHLASDFSAMSEILNVRSCTQINLVKFLGCSLHQGSLYAVSEFVASQTDLRTALRNSRMRDHTSVISSFSGSQLSNFALAIADGLRYLHGHSVPNGNICSSQILLTEQMVPKLKGCCGKNSFRLRKHKTLRWAAPEVVTDHEYLIASDLWSYAIVVWEIATLGGLPYPRVSEKGIKHHLESLQNGQYPMPNCRNIVRRLWTILQSCWELNPNERPTIADVYKKSSKLREATTSIFVAVSPGYEFAPTTVLQKRQ